ncbi:Na-Ca exchanger/integrin-beta4 [Thioploca ingrica]|uniref:Na-Ca exchanger/integrin-beta4 n=1 Tax=Thioploca ingrica TaxID=40754 RepID=A0A090AHM6_9GAMM|nr:Na-Ca exchanger/integrin-beta4 [Thioploca ingrica]
MRSHHKETVYKLPIRLTRRFILTLGILFFLPIQYVAAAIIVNSTADNVATDIKCTLREAIRTVGGIATADCPNDNSGIIQFDSSLKNQTIDLSNTTDNPTATFDTTSRLYINPTNNLTIDGADNLITLSNSATTAGKRVLRIAPGKTVTIIGMTIINGMYTAALNEGAGIYNEGTLTLTRCLIKDNTARIKGGGIYNKASLTLNNNTFYNNKTAVNGTTLIEGGGGIYNETTGTLTINNSTIGNNQAAGSANKGGGIYNANNLTINNSTIVYNTANTSGTGGGIYSAGGTVTVKNSIVGGNLKGAAANDCGVTAPGVITSGGYNLIVTGGGCTTVGTDKSTTALSTILNSLSPPNYYYSLNVSSSGNVAINAISNGTNGCGTAPLDFDQLGVARPQGTGCDIGAYEVQQPTITYTFTPPSLLSAKEDSAGTQSFTVTQSATANCGNASIQYTITGTASPPPATDADYQTTLTNGQKTTEIEGTISLGTSSVQSGAVNLQVTPDKTVEPDETFIVTFPISSSNPTLPTSTCPEILNNYFASPKFILPTTTSSTFTIKNDDLAVLNITRLDPTPTNANSVSYLVTFSDGITNLDASDFTTTNGAPISSITSTDNKNYTVTVDISNSINGDFQLKLLNSATIAGVNPDLVFNGIEMIGDTYTIDKPLPYVISLDIAPDSYKVSTITIQFNEAVKNFDLSDLKLTLDNGSNLLTNAQTLTTTDDITWIVGNLDSLTETVGNYTFTVIAAGITNRIGNLLLANKDTTWERLRPVFNMAKLGEGIGTITVNGVDCGSTCSNRYAIGDTVLLVATPDKDSYFDSWGGDCSSSSLTMTKDTKVMNCTGTFHLKSNFVLKINKAGEGTGTITVNGIDCGTTCNSAYPKGSIITLTVTPTEDSYFVSWDGACNASPFTMTTDTTCTVTFEKKPTFTLNINKAGKGSGTITGSGINCGTVCQKSYLIDDKISLIVTPAENSVFVGWEGDCSASSFAITKNMNCIANFREKSNFTLNISKAGKGTGTITGSGIYCGTHCSSVYLEGETVTLTVTPAENSSFGGWEGDCTTSSFAMTTDMNCIANFQEKPVPPLSKTMILTLTQQGTGEGEFVFQPAVPVDRIDCDTDKKQCRYTIDTATWIKVTAKPNSDSRFMGWSGANSKCNPNKDNQLEFFMSEDYSCTAEFESNPKVLSLVTVGNGQVTISPVGNSIPCETGTCFQFAANSEVKLTPQAGNEFHFYNWSGDSDCQDGQVKMDTDKICVATFGDTLPVNLVLIYDHSQGQIALTPVGENCGDNCQRYKSGTSVTLTAQPQPGFQLASWGDCSNQTQTTLGMTLTKDWRCEVTFMPATNPPPIDPNQPAYSLTVNLMGGGLGTITSLPGGINCGLNCTAHYQANTAVKLQAELAPNSIFVGWSESCPQGQVYLNADKTCLATFEVPGVVEWTSPAQIDVTEEDKPLILKVGRLGGKYGAAAVDYTITDVTTTAGSDYNATTAGTLTWAAGDNTEKTVTLTILPDKLKEETESLTVTLANPQGGVRLGTSTMIAVRIADVPAFSSIQLSMPEYKVNEGGKKEAVVFVTRAGKSGGTVSTDFQTIDGTAIANNDYTPVSGTLTWADGDRTQQAIKIPILQDSLNENHETFGIQLANLTGEAQFGQYAQATVTIVDTPSMGSLEFSQPEYRVNESAGKATIQVNRIGDSSGEVSVNYTTTAEGSAQVGQDFTPSQGVLQWTNGDSEPKFFDIPISVDEQPEGEETVDLSLSNPTGGASLGAISTAILKITDVVDDNTNPPPATETSTIQFTGSTYEIMEQAAIKPLEGLIRVPVNRTGSSKGPATVKYMTQDGTAIAGKNYQASQGQVTWADGETGEKWINIDSWDNKLKEETKSFSLLLSQPNGAVLGEYPQTTVLIKDDDGSVVGFSSKNNYLALEKSGQAQVTVSRSNSSVGQATLHYTTVDGTAKAGEDYSPTEGILTWADGESGDKTISIPLIADQITEDNETIQLRLSDPQGDVVLAQPSEVAVTIIETETTPCEVTGKVIDCFLVLSTDSPILQDVKITSRGAVTGGRLAGQIQNAGRVQNVMLMPNSILMGGQVTGSLSGDSEQPTTAFLRYVKIKGAHLEHVVIGEGCQFDPSTTLGDGVLFQANELVPEQNLDSILGYMEQSVFGQRAVKLRGDVLYLSAINGLLGTINNLPQLANSGWQVKLEPRYGFLTLDVGDLRFAAMPLQVNQTLTAMIEGISLGMTSQADGQVIFRNQNGREIITQPVVQNPAALQDQLRQLGLNVEMLANGNLKATLANGYYLIGRAGLSAQQVSQETPLGLHYTDQPAYLVFKDDQGQRWQQFIYPAAADPQVLANQTEEVFLANDGQLQVRQGGRVYQGRLDYLVITGKQPRSGNLQFKEIADINGDHCGDYQIVYSSQENQVMFGQCSSR